MRATIPKALAVLVPAAAAAVLLLVGGERRTEGPEDRARRALAAFQNLDSGLERSLVRGAMGPYEEWARAGEASGRSDLFGRLEALRADFPEDAFLEAVGADGAPAAWAGDPPPEAEAFSPRALLAGAARTGFQPVILLAGPFVWLGRAEAVPSSSPPLLLAAWVRLDVADPSFLPLFPEATLARGLSGDRPGSVRFLAPGTRAPRAEAEAFVELGLPGPASADAGTSPGRLRISRGGPPPARGPGAAASLAGGVAALLALLWTTLWAWKAARVPGPLRFLALLGAGAGAWAALRGLDFPGRLLGGAAFAPRPGREAAFPGAPASPGDFLVAVLFATGATAAFVLLVPPVLHRLAERSRRAAAAQALLFPFAAPLLGLALARGLAGLVSGWALDPFPSGTILLPLPETLLLLGLFLAGLDFALLGATLLHLPYRALLPYAGGKSALLAFLAAAAASALVLAPLGPSFPAWAPAAVLLLLHPVHLTLRKEGLTALHAGAFLLAAAMAVFPSMRGEARRLKRCEAEDAAARGVAAARELPQRLERAIRCAGGPWRGAVPADSPLLAFLLWARSGLDVPGLSVRLEVKDPAWRSEYRAGPAPSWPWDEPKFIGPYMEPRPGRLLPIRVKGRDGYLGQARSPEGFQVTLLAFWEWPVETPSHPPRGASGGNLALGYYERGHLVRCTRPGLSPGRPLPARAGTPAPVWIREEYPWGPAEVLYRPGHAPGSVLSAAYPAITSWGETLGFLRLFLTGLAFAVAAWLVFATARGLRTRKIRFHRRMKHRLVASFALISVVPLFLLAFYMQRGMVERIRSDLKDRARLELDLVSELIREEVAILDHSKTSDDPVPGVTPKKIRQTVDSADLRQKAAALDIEWDMFFPSGTESAPPLEFSSRREALDARLLASRLPAAAFRDLLLGSEVYGYELGKRGDLLVLKGWKRLLDRDLNTAALLSTTRYVPEWMAEAEIARGISITLALYLLSLIAVGFVGLILARRIALPLEKLTEATQAVAGGDLAVRVRIASGDEIGDLVESFNKMTAQLQEGRERIVRAEKESAWREMARQIAHEIKNPLTPMKLSAQHILRAHADRSEKFDAILDEGLRRITEQVDALGRIAQDFSDFAKFPKRNLAPLDLNRLLRETMLLIAEEAQGDARAPAIVFREECDPALPPVVADADEMRRVFINLLRNAIQAMAEAGGEVRVSTRRVEKPAPGETEARKGKTRFLGAGRKPPEPARFVEIRVADTGPGIPPEARAQLFQPYFSTKSGGTGLGLAICKRAMDDLGGEISIESEARKGTAVTLRFPLPRPAGTP